MFIIHPAHFLPPRGQRARKFAVVFLMLAPLCAGLLALALGQDMNWDLRNYHFYNAYAFLNGRYAKDFLPAQTPSFYNPLLDLPFYLMAVHWPARAVAFALGCAQGLNVVLLFMLAHAVLVVPNPRHKAAVCAALAALGFLGGGGIALVGTTFGDNITSLGALLSAALAARHLDRLSVDKAARALPLALLFGLPCGLAMGLKLPTAIYAVGLCGGFLFAGGGIRRRLLLALFFGFGVLLGLAVTYGYWGAFLNTHYGSPTFPYFNDIFRSPLLPPGEGRDVDFVPHGWFKTLFFPFVIAFHPKEAGEIFWRDWRLPALYALLPLALALRLSFGRNRAQADAVAAPYAARYLLASFAIAYLPWLLLFGIYRYAVTLEMAAPLLIVLAAGMLPLKPAPRALVTAFILAVISASIIPGNWGRRDGWTHRFIEADIPPLGDASNLTILMAGKAPYSHLVPEFPPQVSFLRIESNLSWPQEKNGVNTILRRRIAVRRMMGSRFLLLVAPWEKEMGEKALAAFGLAPGAGACQTVTDRLYDDQPMDLCPVTAKMSPR